MIVTLNIISDILGDPNIKTGKQKVIKSGVLFKKTFDTNTITVQEYIDTKGNISKKYCTVYEGELGYKAVHKFAVVEKMLKHIVVTGFKRWE